MYQNLKYGSTYLHTSIDMKGKQGEEESHQHIFGEAGPRGESCGEDIQEDRDFYPALRPLPPAIL